MSALDFCLVCGEKVYDFAPGGYEREGDGQRGHFACDALAYVDKTIDNVVELPSSPWRSDEVVTMLRELRELLVADLEVVGALLLVWVLDLVERRTP